MALTFMEGSMKVEICDSLLMNGMRWGGVGEIKYAFPAICKNYIFGGKLDFSTRFQIRR